MILVIVLTVCITVLLVVSKLTSSAYELFHAWLDTRDGATAQQQELVKVRDQLNSLEDRHAELSQKLRQALGVK